MFLIVFAPSSSRLSRVVPPLCNGTSGAPAPGSSQDPVSVRSRLWKDSNTMSSVSFNNTFIQEYITSPLYVYIRRMSSEYLRALQTSFYGVGLSPRQYTVWNEEGGVHAQLEGYLSVGAAADDALHCQRWEVNYLKLILTLKEPNNRLTHLGMLGWYL